ncbi:MAG: hypothetical protein JWM52_675 [Candidatus Saccharibacteria bacterium]|nr:hypothetical protein [Candidatus Saccharibacteria bacterium]
MSQSPRPIKPVSQTTTKSPQSASMLLIVTALDTTWRAFVPTIGGTFLGIGLDHLFHVTPIATIVCMILGGVASGVLIVKQVRDVRKPR